MNFTYDFPHAASLYCDVNGNMIMLYSSEGNRHGAGWLAAQVRAAMPWISQRQASKAAAAILRLTN
tara:strand:+ start:226 stop:423 length:198 start_codon:yes stop_codon:yes gene_type:complete